MPAVRDMEPWELTARERVRDTLARYSWSADAGRAGDLAAAFCPDGVLELRGGAAHRGREAIGQFLSGVTRVDGADGARADRQGPLLVRHLLTNTRFVEVTPSLARVESYFTVVTEVGLDHAGRYRDELVPVDGAWLIRHRLVSTDWTAADSVMARPDRRAT